MPTVFFSWQADTPTREGRNFIERALERATSRISADTTVEDAIRELAVDRDTKGIPGSPPIVETIFQKIDDAAVFVPDLTFVGQRRDGRPTPNPNVLIEYGWALKKLGHARIVPVMNAAIGVPTAENMPFDLRHLRNPITYSCNESATEQERKAANGTLSTRRRLTAVAAWLWLVLPATAVSAQTLPDSLVRAYQSNPQLNAERARQRATDENVPQALSGYRPQIMASLSAGLAAVRTLLPDNTVQTASLRPWTIGVTVTQNLFNGFKTASSVRVAEAQVMSGREALRNVGQGVLLDAVTAYMNVLANQTLVDSQRLAVQFYSETQAVTQRRLNAGDVTPTDTAQAEARLSRAKADLNAAEVALAISQALFAQVIGVPPGRLGPAQQVDRLLSHSREEALEAANRGHPAILAAGFDVDVAEASIHVAESSLMPQLNVQGSVSREVQTDNTLGSQKTDQASVTGQLAVPLYDGGMAASQTRQAKEVVAQSRLVLDQVRNQTRTAVISAWVASEGAKIAVAASEAEVRAATVALQGVQREAQGGQRTTVDVLNAQQDLMAARARLIVAQRDRIIASYTLLAAMGQLDVKTLGLNTPDYLPEVHYHQVRDAWHGVRTPSGR